MNIRATRKSLHSLVALGIFAIMSAILASCTITPSTITQGPSTVKPIPEVRYSNNNGSIYQERTFKPLFEDKRARFVGDTITIQMTEKTTSDKKNNQISNNTSTVSVAPTALGGTSPNGLADITAKGGGTRKFDFEDSGITQNTFNTTLTATVVEVLPNGNLVVSGEKQIGFDKSTEFIRFSGVVSPGFIGIGNIVSSTNVADARIEYRTNVPIDKSTVANMFSRFFYSIFPL